MLKEPLNFSGAMGIILCLIGSITIVLHAPTSTAVETLPDFFKYVFAPCFFKLNVAFIVYSFFALLLLLYLVFKLGPKYGHVCFPGLINRLIQLFTYPLLQLVRHTL
jgi:hypothetical protein